MANSDHKWPENGSKLPKGGNNAITPPNKEQRVKIASNGIQRVKNREKLGNLAIEQLKNGHKTPKKVIKLGKLSTN